MVSMIGTIAIKDGVGCDVAATLEIKALTVWQSRRGAMSRIYPEELSARGISEGTTSCLMAGAMLNGTPAKRAGGRP
jgi:hypothetical protein